MKGHKLILVMFAAIVLATVFSYFTKSSLAQNHFVSIDSSGFIPGSITIDAGDEVTWTNIDAAVHEIISDSALGNFVSGVLGIGDTYSYTFVEPGVYEFRDSNNPDFVAIITVREPEEPEEEAEEDAADEDEIALEDEESDEPSDEPGEGEESEEPGAEGEGSGSGEGAGQSEVTPPPPPPGPQEEEEAEEPADEEPLVVEPIESIYEDGTIILDEVIVFVIDAGYKRPLLNYQLYRLLGYERDMLIREDLGDVPFYPGYADLDERELRRARVDSDLLDYIASYLPDPVLPEGFILGRE